MEERLADRSALLESIGFRINEIKLELARATSQLQQITGLVNSLMAAEKRSSGKPIDYIHDIETGEPRGIQFGLGREVATIDLLDCGLLEMTDDHHDIVLLEYQSGEPRLLVWPDINSADPIEIDLSKAKLTNRSVE